MSDMKCSIKILIAEDDALNRMMLERLMQRFETECAMAKDGQDALDRFASDYFDAVFLDVNMPAYTGPECAELIRKQCAETGRETPLLVCISADDDYSSSDLFDNYLAKPFNLDNIKSLVDFIYDCKCGTIDYSPEKAAQLIGLDLETMMMLMDEFILVFDEEVVNLKKAVKEKNAEMTTHVAHKMKGAAANMHTELLRSLCAQMQETDKNDHHAVTALYRKIYSSYCAFKRTISS